MSTAADVLANRAAWAVEAADALVWLRSLPDRCVSLVLTSPPYERARTYDIGFKLWGEKWVEWFRPYVVGMCRVSSGLVCVNAAGVVRKGRYSGVVEMLVADLIRKDGLVCGPAPYAWVRSGTPGSGGKHYHRRSWEPVYSFAMPDRLPLVWSNNTAFGKPPKYAPGGEFSDRLASEARVNQWGGRATSGRSRKADGEMQKAGRPSHKFTSTRRRQGTDQREAMTYTPPPIANPGNVIKTHSGGNHQGHELAHENEAPMCLTVAERFVCWYCPPSGVVLDCFCGSGTTCHAAVANGRRFVGCDVRESQAELTRRRMTTVTPSLFTEE